jgi:hypothetical protein
MGEDVGVDGASFSCSGTFYTFTLPRQFLSQISSTTFRYLPLATAIFNTIGQGSWAGLHPGGSILTGIKNRSATKTGTSW